MSYDKEQERYDILLAILAFIGILLLLFSVIVYLSQEVQSINYTHNETVENITKVYNTQNNFTDNYYQNITRIYYRDSIEFQVPTQHICGDEARLRKIKGMSMFPALAHNHKNWFEPVKYEELQLGDIIEFEKEGKRITHAIVNLYDNRLKTAGYKNPEKDSYWVYPEEVKLRQCWRLE